jgi:YVTN family beta-propeller protein
MTGLNKEHAMRGALLIAMCLFGALSATAQRTIETPPIPASVHAVGDIVHVFCAQSDIDYDGKQETGELPAAWLQIDRSSLQVLRRFDFPWANIQVFRLGIASETNRAYIVINGKVEEFKLDDQSPLGVVYSAPGTFSVSTTSAGNSLYIAHRPSFTDPGNVVRKVLSTGDSTSFAAGPNPQQAVRFRTSDRTAGVIILSEGVFGQESGSIDLWENINNVDERVTLDVGDTPNHITVHGDSAYVTANGSHWVAVIDLVTRKVVDTLLIGTEGFDGPRESVVANGKLIVSTYAGDVRVIDLVTRKIMRTIPIGAKPEGLCIAGEDLWVTRTYNDDYSPAKDVVVYRVIDATSVQSDMHTPVTPRAIIATGTTVRLPFMAGSALTMRTLDGRTSAIHTVDSGHCTIDVSTLSRGVYVITDGTSSVTLMR